MMYRPTLRPTEAVSSSATRWHYVVATVVLSLTIQACSTGGESTTTTAPSVAPSSTTVEPTATTSASSMPTTSNPATTSTSLTVSTSPDGTATSSPPPSSTSTSPTESAPPTTALDPAATEVADAYRAAFDSWTECLGALPNCVLDTLAETRAGAYLDAAVVQAGRYNEAGQTVDGLDSRVATVESVEILDQSRANVVACEVDASVRRDATGAILNDALDSARTVFVLSRDDGTWKVIGSEDLETGTGPGENVCAS